MLSRLLCRLALLVLCIPFLILLGHVEEVLIDVTLVEVCLVLVLFSELLDVHFVQFLSRFALFLDFLSQYGCWEGSYIWADAACSSG